MGFLDFFNREPILQNGLDFSDNIPYEAISVVFTDAKAPFLIKKIDVSERRNGSVIAWLEGTTWYVSSQRQGVNIIANNDCTGMFGRLNLGEKQLIDVDCSRLDTSRVTNMNWMFFHCSKLKNIKFGNYFNTCNVTTMVEMFCSCRKLTYLDLMTFNTSNVTNMMGMFRDCEKLNKLLHQFNLPEGVNTHNIFQGCENLQISS